ncbi:hypothetical protein BC826DRAFT_996723 [Russula brevipes]|nr:hypothetical protein BC826DRAFT_996723 [Russula brevipes]
MATKSPIQVTSITTNLPSFSSRWEPLGAPTWLWHTPIPTPQMSELARRSTECIQITGDSGGGLCHGFGSTVHHYPGCPSHSHGLRPCVPYQLILALQGSARQFGHLPYIYPRKVILVNHTTSQLVPGAGYRADPLPIATLSWGGRRSAKPERGIKWKTQCSAYLHATVDQARNNGFWCHLDWARRHTSTSEDPHHLVLVCIRLMNCIYPLWKAASRG